MRGGTGGLGRAVAVVLTVEEGSGWGGGLDGGRGQEWRDSLFGGAEGCRRVRVCGGYVRVAQLMFCLYRASLRAVPSFRVRDIPRRAASVRRAGRSQMQRAEHRTATAVTSTPLGTQPVRGRGGGIRQGGRGSAASASTALVSASLGSTRVEHGIQRSMQGQGAGRRGACSSGRLAACPQAPTRHH